MRIWGRLQTGALGVNGLLNGKAEVFVVMALNKKHNRNQRYATHSPTDTAALLFFEGAS